MIVWSRSPFIIKPLAAAQNQYHIDPHKPFYTSDCVTERTIDDRSTELCAWWDDSNTRDTVYVSTEAINVFRSHRRINES
jgi:hypothetical protein